MLRIQRWCAYKGLCYKIVTASLTACSESSHRRAPQNDLHLNDEQWTSPHVEDDFLNYVGDILTARQWPVFSPRYNWQNAFMVKFETRWIGSYSLLRMSSMYRNGKIHLLSSLPVNLAYDSLSNNPSKCCREVSFLDSNTHSPFSLELFCPLHSISCQRRPSLGNKTGYQPAFCLRIRVSLSSYRLSWYAAHCFAPSRILTGQVHQHFSGSQEGGPFRVPTFGPSLFPFTPDFGNYHCVHTSRPQLHRAHGIFSFLSLVIPSPRPQ